MTNPNILLHSHTGIYIREEKEIVDFRCVQNERRSSPFIVSADLERKLPSLEKSKLSSSFLVKKRSYFVVNVDIKLSTNINSIGYRIQMGREDILGLMDHKISSH